MLKVHFNRDYSGPFMCAEGGGGRELVANRAKPDVWETFRLTNLSGGRLQHLSRIALQASDRRYIYAQGGGGGRLYAKGAGVGDWEPFAIHDVDFKAGELIHNRKVALQAVHGQYVFAENGGWAGVLAQGAAIGAWERFRMSMFAECTFTSVHGKLLCANHDDWNNPGYWGRLVANRTSVGAWERFRLLPGTGWPLVTGDYYGWMAVDNRSIHLSGDRLLVDASGVDIFREHPKHELRLHLLETLSPDVYRVAIQIPRGPYVYATPRGAVVAGGPEIGEWEPFTLRVLS
jgi:hypothetical protein